MHYFSRLDQLRFICFIEEEQSGAAQSLKILKLKVGYSNDFIISRHQSDHKNTFGDATHCCILVLNEPNTLNDDHFQALLQVSLAFKG